MTKTNKPFYVSRRDIIHYRKMVKQQWHDTLWHHYMQTTKARMIEMAESELSYYERDYHTVAGRAMYNYERLKAFDAEMVEVN